jgi:hypothetical protein
LAALAQFGSLSLIERDVVRAPGLRFRMRRTRAAFLLAAVCTVFGGGAVRGEDLALLGGVTANDGGGAPTYAWGLEYREHLLLHLDASFGYLNEGHLVGHDRDGGLLQLWVNSGPWLRRVQLALGAGPYAYFDTQDDHANATGYSDRHGVGLILSGYASLTLSPHWFALLEINQVLAPGDIGTRTVMLGAGYRLDSFIEQLQRAQASDSGAIADVANELGVFGGQTIINDLHSERSTNFGVEYRRRTARHVEVSASFLDEADGPGGRNAGVTGEVWLVQSFLSRHLVTGIGLGPYVALQKYYTADGRSGASLIGLASMTVSWRFSRFLALRCSWHRGVTTDDQDRDILTAGLAWRF